MVVVRPVGGYPPHSGVQFLRNLNSQYYSDMTTEIRNWAVVAAAMEARGATNSDMYRRAKALASGKSDPMPTSYPAAPLSISAA